MLSLSPDCYVIGLTGGIASGKSAASDFFQELGCDVIDADIIARQVVEVGTEGLRQLIKTFGDDILKSDNTLDRSRLRKLVFNDEHKLTKLNAILHPLIEEQILKQVKIVEKSYCIVVIPLLCESSRYQWLDRVLVVDVSPEFQQNRLMKRDAIDQKLARKMMASQCTREQRLKIADDVIKNEKSLKELKQNVEKFDNLYKQFIKSRKNMHFD